MQSIPPNALENERECIGCRQFRRRYRFESHTNDNLPRYCVGCRSVQAVFRLHPPYNSDLSIVQARKETKQYIQAWANHLQQRHSFKVERVEIEDIVNEANHGINITERYSRPKKQAHPPSVSSPNLGSASHPPMALDEYHRSPSHLGAENERPTSPAGLVPSSSPKSSVQAAESDASAARTERSSDSSFTPQCDSLILRIPISDSRMQSRLSHSTSCNSLTSCAKVLGESIQNGGEEFGSAIQHTSRQESIYATQETGNSYKANHEVISIHSSRSPSPTCSAPLFTQRGIYNSAKCKICDHTFLNYHFVIPSAMTVNEFMETCIECHVVARLYSKAPMDHVPSEAIVRARLRPAITMWTQTLKNIHRLTIGIKEEGARVLGRATTAARRLYTKRLSQNVKKEKDTTRNTLTSEIPTGLAVTSAPDGTFSEHTNAESEELDRRRRKRSGSFLDCPLRQKRIRLTFEPASDDNSPRTKCPANEAQATITEDVDSHPVTNDCLEHLYSEPSSPDTSDPSSPAPTTLPNGHGDLENHDCPAEHDYNERSDEGADEGMGDRTSHTRRQDQVPETTINPLEDIYHAIHRDISSSQIANSVSEERLSTTSTTRHYPHAGVSVEIPDSPSISEVSNSTSWCQCQQNREDTATSGANGSNESRDNSQRDSIPYKLDAQIDTLFCLLREAQEMPLAPVYNEVLSVMAKFVANLDLGIENLQKLFDYYDWKGTQL